MKPREYDILVECVERGIQLGWARAHKHQDNPTQDQLQTTITDAVMLSISEYFIFDEGSTH